MFRVQFVRHMLFVTGTGTQINFHLAATPVTYECAKLKAKKIDPLKNFSPTNQSWKMYFLRQL